MSTLRCPSCGAPLRLDECRYCGSQQTPANPLPAQEEEDFSTKVGKGIFRLARITIIGAILIVITLIGSCVLLVLSSDSAREQPPPPLPLPARPPPPSQPSPPPAYEIHTGHGLADFAGVHSVPTNPATRSASIVDFSWQGSVLSAATESMRSIDGSIRRVVIEGDRLYGVDTHDFGEIVGSNARFEKIKPPAELPEMNWTAGLTSDSGRILILRSHVYSHIYTFEPSTHAWRVLHESRGALRGLAADVQSGELFSLQPQHQAHGEELAAVAVFNAQGALMRTVPLSPPIVRPELLHNDWRDRLQLFVLDERLMVLIPGAWDRETAAASPRLAYAIDSRTGRVEKVDIRD